MPQFGTPFFEVKTCEAVQMPRNARQALRATYFCRNVSVPQSQSNKEKLWLSLQFIPLSRDKMSTNASGGNSNTIRVHCDEIMVAGSIDSSYL
jgi:hypothetical protein